MKRISALVMLSLASVIAIPAATPQVALKANVPFAFTVGDRALPAGEYTVCSPDRGVVRLLSPEQHIIASIPVAKSYADPTGKDALVFAKYRNQYFLRQIISQTTDRLNVEVPLWHQEEIARSGEGILVAMR